MNVVCGEVENLASPSAFFCVSFFMAESAMLLQKGIFGSRFRTLVWLSLGSSDLSLGSSVTPLNCSPGTLFSNILADITIAPPDHAIVVMASDLKFQVAPRRYKAMPDVQKNCIVAHCSDADVTTPGSKKIDPLLKLFIGHKVMMNDNINVENKIANSAMASFNSVKLKHGLNDCFIVNVNGCCV